MTTKRTLCSILFISAMVLPLLVGCSKSSDEPPVVDLEDNGIYTLSKKVGISPDDYEWWGSYDRDEWITITGYKKGTDNVFSWYWNRTTNEITRYSGSIKRTFDADLGYGNHATLDINISTSLVSKELDIDGNHVMKMIAKYDGNDAEGKYQYAQRQKVFLLKPGNTSVDLFTLEELNDYESIQIMEWYNNSFAISSLEEEGSVIYSSQGNKLTSFPYSIKYYNEDIKAKILEFYDYNKALMYSALSYADENGCHELMIDFIDLSQCTSHRVMESVRQAIFRMPVPSDDSRTKYSAEVIESSPTSSKFRMTLTEYSGEKKSFKFMVDKVNYKAEVIE